MKNFMICTSHQLLFGCKNKGLRDTGTLHLLGRRNMHAKFWWEDFGNRTPDGPRRSWEDNIKMDLNKIGWWEDVDWINLYQGRNVAVCELPGQRNCQLIMNDFRP